MHDFAPSVFNMNAQKRPSPETAKHEQPAAAAQCQG